MKRSRSGTSKLSLHNHARIHTNFLSSLFTAAATSINVKLYNDDGDEDDTVSRCFSHSSSTLTRPHQDTPPQSGSRTPLDRTSTGILSNKPQKAGLSVLEAPVALQSNRVSIMTLAKRETARRGLYSRFFRGTVLGPDPEAGDPPAPEAVNQLSPSRTESNGLEHSTSITEKRNKKRKCLEVGETAIVQKRRKQEGGDGTKDERNKRRLQNPKKAAEKGEGSEIKTDGCVETGPPKTLDPSEGLVHGDDGVGHSRKKDHKKKRKRKHKDKESVAHHDD
jgi:hypothetical protein